LSAKRTIAGLKPGLYKCPDKVRAHRPAGTREALPGTKVFVYTSKRLNVRTFQENLAIGEHLLDGRYVCGIHQRQLLEFAHAAVGFGAGKMALAGVHALDLARGGYFEALSCAAVRLQFQFWF
jgi:hypothetical protein